MVTTHSHGPDHGHSHHHPHSHGPAAPHPAQAVTWSILRMTVLARFAAAAAVSAALWAFIWLAMN
ncbi:hypothetical protein [Bradyrhizobium erythrophlei]|uniref:Uncharacterized protein n=1 Tax=Bradyrhizobium erythrophlei TaxID=1437360 RepID=A0A1M7U6T6_9BRAD|nr:hypothetical protein [Bradyrhizobium erythrophlei]SHN78782.1 hypothetical protein SAMN05444170_3785 [Bradyrhizobium erythrophlei]